MSGHLLGITNYLEQLAEKKNGHILQRQVGVDSDAFCETTITWDTGVKKYKTRGLDTDQTVAAIKATEKMLNT